MKIGIIGAGNIGYNVAKLFALAGHEIALSNSRGPESLQEAVAGLGPNVHAETIDNAAAFGELVFLAVPWRRPEALPHPDLVANKIVIDAMNQYGNDSKVIDLGDRTASEEIAKRLPDARLVKAFNTLWYEHLATLGDPAKPEAERVTLFVSGDDASAKAVVADLIRQIGFAPVDLGSLREGGRKQQPQTPIYGKVITPEKAQQLVEDK